MTEFQPYLLVALPILGGLAGYYLNNFLAKKKEIELLINKEKRGHYQLFINLFIDILAQKKTGRLIAKDELFKRFYEFQKSHILYSSPEVITSFGKWWQSAQNLGDEESNQKPSLEVSKNVLVNMTKFILVMRKDLGLKNKKLGENGEELLRGMLTDYEKVFSKS